MPESDYVYCWADGVDVSVRLEEAKLCMLVLVGVRADARKELISPRRWAPRVHRVLSRSAARCPPARYARPSWRR